MITLSRGLVLRHGDRQLEFERDLGDGRVQFKYLDTFEVCTFKAFRLLKDIFEGKFKPTSVPAAQPGPQPAGHALPVSWSPKQLALIDFRMEFVQAVLNQPCRTYSREQCATVANQVWSRHIDAVRCGERPISTHKCPSGSTVELWLHTYLRADRNAYALADRRAFVVRPKRISATVDEIVNQILSKSYLSLRGPSVREVHGEIKRTIAQHNRQHGVDLKAPSERTVDRRVAEIPPYIRDCKRVGMGYAKNNWRYSLHGDMSTRIMERVEVDHTLLDVWVIDPRTGVPLGRPWITLLIDRYSGYLLGLYVSFYGPSAATVARALKFSILPKEELVEALDEHPLRWTAMGVPELIVVDNGLEFHSAQFKRIGWELRCDMLFNPVRQPWFKPAIERAIKESNRVLPSHGRVHTVIRNAVAPDPSKTSAIIFDDLCTCLIEWASQTHPLSINATTLCRSWDLWEEGRQSSPPAMFPTQLSGLDLLCGLNAHRTVDGDGVFFKYLRFNSEELQDYRRMKHENFRTEIRFNPDDLSSVFVHLPRAKSWLNVPLQRPLFNDGCGLSLVQLEIVREEAKKRLTRANAYEEMEKAIWSLRDKWEQAASRGLRVRKDAKLIRMQGLTSVPMTPSSPLVPPSQEPLMLVSPAMQQALPKVMPFPAFSLED
ncbi:Mu transposase C-terminal domain-containing protein [Curvibacter sp. HBC28]|uniref:Mu transposase C-terminal domain-containing protein n=1 Tax=Curvibacter microcysteis TaxID=3026419 RepID=A0ABT5ME36_9BURK|nr:Mu transposase C-terminal domain-containing protein [Curvibacter sp. HBC28]MDD0813376.1 Mu transposase C-terminal domain-containing protein [Curvibacter sp. HBC28]